MKKYKIILVAGARPNFMKIAPLMKEFRKHEQFDPLIVHTGQHYDDNMSDLFFRQLNIPKPDINLEVGSDSHARQTARIMERFEKVCIDEKPDLVIVVGDVNSTAACTLVASKLHIKTAHYEAGLRSRDKSMPEEINRMVTDAICDLYFTTSKDADGNLVQEGIDSERIHMVGNLMIDTLANNLERTKNITVELETLDKSKVVIGSDLKKYEYGVMTFHRPANVDSEKSLNKLVNIWQKIGEDLPLIFPAHPRTIKNAEQYGLLEKMKDTENLILTEPIGYLEFINLLRNARIVLTDSGGIQEETTYMGIPCLTVRPNTERPITIWEGTNKLINIDEIESEVEKILQGQTKSGQRPKYWDGKSAKRIAKILMSGDFK